MINGDVVMFVTSGLINAQTWQNTYFYRVEVNGVLDPGYFPAFVEAWWNDVLEFYFDSSMLAVYSSAMSLASVKAENLFQADEVGGYQAPSPLVGGTAGSVALAQFNSFGFTQPNGFRGMNSGKRRVPGVTEAAVGSFGLVDSGTKTVLDTQAARFSQQYNPIGASPTFDIVLDPVIVKRVRSGSGTAVSPYKYRLPRTQAESTEYLATSWSADPYITTQNSRKTGRGI